MASWLSPIITMTMGFIGLYITIRHFKLVRTVSYIERMNHPNMADIRARVDAWLDSGLPNDERLRQLQEDPDLSARVTIFYNVLTELAIAYRYRTINRRLTRDIWDPLVPSYWEKMRFYILASRARGVSLGHNFEFLAHQFTKFRFQEYSFGEKKPDKALE